MIGIEKKAQRQEAMNVYVEVRGKTKFTAETAEGTGRRPLCDLSVLCG
jgi:hypothetical protein